MNLASYKPAEVKINQFPKLAYKKSQLFDKLKNKSENIAVVGLGYVGLPLAIHMASTLSLIHI